VKCCKYIFLILVILNFQIAYSDTVVFHDQFEQTIEPIGEQVIHNGKIRNFKINSELSDEELKKLENTFATELVYILKYKKNGTVRQFEAMVANPIKKEKSKDKKEKPIIYPFKLISAEYKFDKKNTTNTFIVFKGLDQLPEGWQRQAAYAIIGIILLIILCFVFKFFQITKGKRRASKKLKVMAQDLIEKFNDANMRSDFEHIYSNRVNIKKLVKFGEKEMNEFFAHLNRIQYKQYWDDSEIEELRSLHGAVKLVGVKSGI
jgi:hypothetical protein